MSYGGGKWDTRAGRARSAGKSKRKRTRTGKKSRRPASARRASKPKSRKRSAKRASTRRTTKRTPKKRQKIVAFYDVNTGKKVAVSKAEYADAYADPDLTTKKPRMVYRYNPDTGRKQRVPDTSEEAATWSSRKPPKGSAGLLLRGYQVGGAAGAKMVAEKAVEKAIRSSSRKINTAVRKAVTRGASAAAAVTGLTATSALGIIGAGLVAYGLGKEAFYPQATVGLRLDAALKNYMALRRALVKRLGRELTRDELRAI